MKLLLFALAAAALMKKSNPGIGNIDDDFSELKKALAMADEHYKQRMQLESITDNPTPEQDELDDMLYQEEWNYNMKAVQILMKITGMSKKEAYQIVFFNREKLDNILKRRRF